MKELVSKELIDSISHCVEIYDLDNIPNHLYFLSSWVMWNKINQHVNNGKYHFVTKSVATSLMIVGAKSGFIEALANGNLLFPDDVISAALMAEDMDRWRKER